MLGVFESEEDRSNNYLPYRREGSSIEIKTADLTKGQIIRLIHFLETGKDPIRKSSYDFDVESTWDTEQDHFQVEFSTDGLTKDEVRRVVEKFPFKVDTVQLETLPSKQETADSQPAEKKISDKESGELKGKDDTETDPFEISDSYRRELVPVMYNHHLSPGEIYEGRRWYVYREAKTLFEIADLKERRIIKAEYRPDSVHRRKIHFQDVRTGSFKEGENR